MSMLRVKAMHNPLDLIKWLHNLKRNKSKWNKENNNNEENDEDYAILSYLESYVWSCYVLTLFRMNYQLFLRIVGDLELEFPYFQQMGSCDDERTTRRTTTMRIMTKMGRTMIIMIKQSYYIIQNNLELSCVVLIFKLGFILVCYARVK